MTTRLDRLRQVAEEMDRGEVVVAGDLIPKAALPDWCIKDAAGNPLRYWFGKADGTRACVLDPFQYVDGALWLAKQALPDELWPPVLTPESGGYGATCEIRTQHDGMIYRACPTLALAVCWSVVAALIAQAEREAA